MPLLFAGYAIRSHGMPCYQWSKTHQCVERWIECEDDEVVFSEPSLADDKECEWLERKHMKIKSNRSLNYFYTKSKEELHSIVCKAEQEEDSQSMQFFQRSELKRSTYAKSTTQQNNIRHPYTETEQNRPSNTDYVAGFGASLEMLGCLLDTLSLFAMFN